MLCNADPADNEWESDLVETGVGSCSLMLLLQFPLLGKLVGRRGINSGNKLVQVEETGCVC